MSPFCKPRTVLYFLDGFVETIVLKTCVYNPQTWSKTIIISLYIKKKADILLYRPLSLILVTHTGFEPMNACVKGM